MLIMSILSTTTSTTVASITSGTRLATLTLTTAKFDLLVILL